MKGTIPIYSANVKEPIGFHTKSNIINFKNNFVLWGIDGDFEFNYFKKDTPFISTDHCGAIRILSDDILPEYLTIQLENIKHKYGFDRGLRASLKNMKTVSIQLPYTQEGLIDIQKQNEIVEKQQNIGETKKKIEEYKDKLKQLTIEITPSKYSFKTIPINDFFDFTRGRVISKKYVERNKGEYPVYSSNTLNDGVFGYINSFDFDCEGLTWTTDGIYAGTLFYRKGKFSITNICGLMTLKKDIPENSIWLPYIQKVIDFRNIATGHDNKKVMTNVILSSNIEVKVPITSNGEVDLLAQQEITKEYQAIEQVKQELEEKLNVLLRSDISLQ